MDASILVVGDDEFLTITLPLVQNHASFSVEVAENPNEAMPLIQAQQPDLLVMQAGQAGGLELCHQLKQQSRLAWIYCIVLTIAPADCATTPVAVAHLQAETEALKAGADAYVAIGLAPQAQDLDRDAKSTLGPQHWSESLVAAHIQAGLRRVQNHRELMRTNDLLSAIALSDPLTELNNRRAFEWELPRQIHNARSRTMPISLLMLDVDFFKSINDTYGHLVGDRALQLLSARLRHNLRFYDTPFRYGGEEFVIILSDTGYQEAALIAQRLCRLIAEQPFALNENLDLTITVSAGTASLLPEDDERGVSLLQRADFNLLQAKSQGRNQAVSSRDVDGYQAG